MAEHDQSYKLLFSHREMVRDLLEGFVHESWTAELAYDTLEKVSGNQTSDDLRERRSDVIWRVRWGKRRIYVYLLLEFQSTAQRFMAVRIQGYLSLLYQDLLRTEQIEADDMLPPVLPIVLYNGERRWRAAVTLQALLQRGPAALVPYRPQTRFLLIDEGRFRDSDLASLRNLVAALFRLENSRSPRDVLNVVERLGEWLNTPEQAELRRAFAVWIDRVILARVPTLGAAVEELENMSTLIEARIKEWKQAFKEEGLEEGRREGRQEGLREGEARLLHRLLQQRFGDLPAWVLPRLQAADSAQLETWGTRVLDADQLEAVFHDS